MRVIGLCLVIGQLAGGAHASEHGRSLRVEQGRFILQAKHGQHLPDDELVGYQWSAGRGIALRLEAMQDDPYAKEPMTLYTVSFRQGEAETWQPLCDMGPYGLALAVPMAGAFQSDGRYVQSNNGSFGFSCTNGAHVKCLRLGYAPWEQGPSGESLAPYHQACTRMMRADYCGDGRAHTVPGRQLQITDSLTPAPETPFGAFEAIWGEDGAICLARSRVEGAFPLSEIFAHCPALAERSRAECDEQRFESEPEALLMNRS